MSKKNEIPLVPKLRFPEFRDSGEWEKLKLSELLTETKHRNRDLEYCREDVLSVSGEYGCVNQIEFLGRSYAGVSVKDYHVVETGDIVYTKSPLKKNPYGIIKENKGKPGIVSTLYAVYRVTAKGNPTYLDHYFSNDYHLNSYLQPIVRKGAKNDMKVNNFAVLGGEVFAPKLPEQQKIAACLSSVDEILAAHTQKLTSLKAHKKGLIQQLFPAEGETVPKLRFPEFRDAPQWIENRLGDLSDVRDGTHDSPQFYSTGKPLLTSKNLLSNGTIDLKNVSFISEVDYEKINKRSRVDMGDILFGMIGTIGNPVMVQSEGFAIKNVALIKQQRHLLNIYLQHFLNGEYIAVKFGILNTGNSQKFIALGQIRNLVLLIPSIPEQQKIADCLSSVDKLISAQAQKLETLKALKKGLMQRLFPSVDEANG